MQNSAFNGIIIIWSTTLFVNIWVGHPYMWFNTTSCGDDGWFPPIGWVIMGGATHNLYFMNS